MPQKQRFVVFALCAFVSLFASDRAFSAFEVFGKAAYSKTYNNPDSYSETLSGAAGLGIYLFPQLRIEGRYTVIGNFQNQIASAGVNDLLQKTNIYSVSLDWDIVSEKYPVRPYLLLGAGYIETFREYTVEGLEFKDETQDFSLNAGAGIRIRIGRSLAFEVEAFGYMANPDKAERLINVYGNVGLRFFI